MRNRSIKNQELDAIGKRLIRSGVLSEAEIDRIAAAPDLFAAVRARIKTDATEEPNRTRSFFAGHRLAFGSAFAVALCVAVFGIYLQQNSLGRVSSVVQVPAHMPDEARPDFTPQVKYVKGFTQGRANLDDEPAVADAPIVERAVYRQPEPVRPSAQRASFQQKQNNEFYAVTYTGDGGESARGGRVIRVDVPRSTLFAMGVNLPLENESPTVKADLLVGPDGVMRAIRLVE